VFNELLREARSAATAVASKFAVRILLALPFLLALGFGTAALTLMLVGPLRAHLSLSVSCRTIWRPRSVRQRPLTLENANSTLKLSPYCSWENTG
jgi:hypothetical protein